MNSQQVAIVGVGAIGGMAAAALARVDHDLTLCVRRSFARLTVETTDAVQQVPARIVNDPVDVTPVDWVLLATKAQDTAGTQPWLHRLVAANTIVVVMQNGIDHESRIAPLLRHGTVLPAIAYAEGQIVAPGRIRGHPPQRYVVPAGPAGAAFARLFEGSGCTVDQTGDFLTATWRKCLANICANPITALTMNSVGILRDPSMHDLAHGILAEAVTVGRAAGAKLDQAEVERLLSAFASYHPNGKTSMLADRLAGRRMEHEYLTGAVVRAASQFDIEVPLNRAVLALLRGLDRSLAPNSRGL